MATEGLSDIHEIEALRRLKARYFRYFDTKEWSAWLSLFTEDAILSWDTAEWDNEERETHTLRGYEEIAGFLVPESTKRRTVHHGHTPELDLISPTEAIGIWAMEDILDYHDHVVHGHGHYHETYRKVDGEWRISSLLLKRLRLKTLLKRQGHLFDPSEETAGAATMAGCAVGPGGEE